MRRGWQAETVQPGEEKAQGDLIHVHKHLIGGNEEEGSRLFSVVSSDRTRGNAHTLGSIWTKKKFLLWKWSNTGTGCPEKMWSLHCGDIKTSSLCPLVGMDSCADCDLQYLPLLCLWGWLLCWGLAWCFNTDSVVSYFFSDCISQVLEIGLNPKPVLWYTGSLFCAGIICMMSKPASFSVIWL